MKTKIYFYPVGNADTTLVKVADGITMQVDCQFSKDTSTFKELSKQLEKDEEKRPYLDVFVLTHPHDDHDSGFGEYYHCGAPEDYNKKDGKIFIRELWVSQETLRNGVSGEAEAVRAEARRRINLWKDKKAGYNKAGNLVKVIGENTTLDSYKEIQFKAESDISTFAGQDSAYLTARIIGPTNEMSKKATDDNNPNLSSIVMQLQFSSTANGYIDSLVILAGDSEYPVIEDAINNRDEEDLKWDLLLAPHHCSWSFFNDTDNKDEVQQTTTDFLNLANTNAYIVASCDKIKDEEPNPPHYEAMVEYKDYVVEDHFIELADDKKATVVSITNLGLAFDKPNSTSGEKNKKKQPRAGEE